MTGPDPERMFHEYLAKVFELESLKSTERWNFSMIHCYEGYGWIESRLNIMDLSIKLVFSDVCPPFFDQVRWLERIIDGQSPTIWFFDDELRDNYFRASGFDGDEMILQYMRYSYPNVEVYTCASVGRRQLVLDCYCGLRHVIECDYEESLGLLENARSAMKTNIYADLYCHGKAEGIEEESIWFEEHESGETIRPNLSRIEDWLRETTSKDITPGEAWLLKLNPNGDGFGHE